MSHLTETILVGVIVGVALAGFVIRLRRARRKGTACSSCASSGDCPLVKADGSVMDLTTLECRESTQKPL